MKKAIASLVVPFVLASVAHAVPYTQMSGVLRYTRLTDGTVAGDYGSLNASGEYTVINTQNYSTEELERRGLSAATLDIINGKFVIDAPFIDTDLATPEGRERLSNFTFSSTKYNTLDFGTVYIITAGGSTPAMPVISVSVTKSAIREGGKPSAIVVKLSRPVTEEVMLRYSFRGTAKINDDYAGPKAARSMLVPTGKTSFRIPIRPVDDETAEPSETIIFKLARNDGYKLGPKKAVTITLKDND